MTIEIKEMPRKVMYNDMEMRDPGPDFSIEEIKEMYTAEYPELGTALIDGPVQHEDHMAYTFVLNTGSKG